MNIIMDQDWNVVVSLSAGQSGDMIQSRPISIDGGFIGMETGTETGMEQEESSGGGASLLSNWLFIGGVSAGVLLLSILIGVLFGRKRIKKGIDLYED